MSERALAVLRGGALAAIGAAMLMWTALVNGRPPVFTDTALYYSQAEYLFEAVGLVSPSHAVEPPDDPTALPATSGAASVSAVIDGARSPLYGAPVYLLQRTGGLWLVAFVQAWAAAAVVYLLYRAAAPSARRWGYLMLMAGLAALTPLPFFASWIMPDVFAGVAVCGLILMLVYPDRLGRLRFAGAAVLTGYGLGVHRSNMLDAAAVAVLAAILLRVTGAAWKTIAVRLGVVMGVGAATIAVGGLLYLPIRARAGEPIGVPPFLSARVLADGPGREALARACTGGRSPYALCAFRTRSFGTSNQILWSNKRRSAVFLATTPAMRLRMEREDAAFALAAVLSDPAAEARAAAANAWAQFVMIGVDDPLKTQRFYVADGFWRRTALPRILPGAQGCMPREACRPVVDEKDSEGLEGLGLGVAALFLAWRLSAPDVRALLMRRTAGAGDGDGARLLVVLAICLGALVANAAVCGALSGPFARYQARLVWLAPLSACLVGAGLGWRRRQGSTTVKLRASTIA